MLSTPFGASHPSDEDLSPGTPVTRQTPLLINGADRVSRYPTLAAIKLRQGWGTRLSSRSFRAGSSLARNWLRASHAAQDDSSFLVRTFETGPYELLCAGTSLISANGAGRDGALDRVLQGFQKRFGTRDGRHA